jgi:hypothetical protein
LPPATARVSLCHSQVGYLLLWSMSKRQRIENLWEPPVSGQSKRPNTVSRGPSSDSEDLPSFENSLAVSSGSDLAVLHETTLQSFPAFYFTRSSRTTDTEFSPSTATASRVNIPEEILSMIATEVISPPYGGHYQDLVCLSRISLQMSRICTPLLRTYASYDLPGDKAYLGSVPTELWSAVCSDLGNADLQALAQTSKRTHAVASWEAISRRRH